MSIIATPLAPDGAQAPQHRPLNCSSCRGDVYLIIETIEPLDPSEQDVVEVSYTCIECATFYDRAATVAQVAGILNRSETVDAAFLCRPWRKRRVPGSGSCSAYPWRSGTDTGIA